MDILDCNNTVRLERFCILLQLFIIPFGLVFANKNEHRPFPEKYPPTNNKSPSIVSFIALPDALFINLPQIKAPGSGCARETAPGAILISINRGSIWSTELFILPVIIKFPSLAQKFRSKSNTTTLDD